MDKKYVDLEGLKKYDKKLKNWHQNHIQDILDKEIFKLFE